jgi:hypothetical protein
MTSAKAHVSATSDARFDINNEEEAGKMLEYLDKYGYAVVAGAASSTDIARAKDSFWTFWEKEKFKGSLDRGDMKTWNNWIANAATGILVSSRGANHNDFLWGARSLPMVKKTFSRIWNDDNLIVSYDSGGVFRPWKYNVQWLTNGGWWHTDQNSLRGPHRRGRVTIQGLVTYYDATAETGGLCVIPGSHLQHDELCERAPGAKMKVDWVSISAGDTVLRSAEPTLVCAKAGDLVLWDSRTVHCNTPALHMTDYFDRIGAVLSHGDGGQAPAIHEDEPMPPPGQPADLLRLVAYVCMVPASHASPEILQKRKQAFLHKLPTSHYPTYEIQLLPPETVDPWTTQREVLELVGYTEREIVNLQQGRPADYEEVSLLDSLLQWATIAPIAAVIYVLLF